MEKMVELVSHYNKKTLIFVHVFAKNPQYKIKPLCCCNFMQKKPKKVPCNVKHEKLAHFWPKNLSQ